MEEVGSKRKAIPGEDILEIMPIGAGSEVGRSCVVLKYKGKTVMVGNTS
jgi:hypothetical protein